MYPQNYQLKTTYLFAINYSNMNPLFNSHRAVNVEMMAAVMPKRSFRYPVVTQVIILKFIKILLSRERDVPEILTVLKWIAFSRKIHLTLSVCFIRKLVAFESRTKFCFQLVI